MSASLPIPPFEIREDLTDYIRELLVFFRLASYEMAVRKACILGNLRLICAEYLSTLKNKYFRDDGR